MAVVALALSPNLFLGVHFNRYLLWAVPGLLVLVAAGLGASARLLAGGDAPLERNLFRAGAALLVVLGLPLDRPLRGALRGDGRRRVPAGRGHRAVDRLHLPPGVRLANLATSVEYLTGHHNLNLHGGDEPRLLRRARRPSATPASSRGWRGFPRRSGRPT